MSRSDHNRIGRNLAKNKKKMKAEKEKTILNEPPKPYIGECNSRLWIPIIEETKEQAGDGLLPCPFCGGEAEADFRFVGTGENTNFFIDCKKCGAESSLFDTEGEAIAAWNTRPASPVDGEARQQKCVNCAGTGYKDWAGFSMDPCDCNRTAAHDTLTPKQAGDGLDEASLCQKLCEWQKEGAKIYDDYDANKHLQKHPDTLHGYMQVVGWVTRDLRVLLDKERATQPAPEPKEDAEALAALDRLSWSPS